MTLGALAEHHRVNSHIHTVHTQSGLHHRKRTKGRNGAWETGEIGGVTGREKKGKRGGGGHENGGSVPLAAGTERVKG